jgi:hypothetical protein
VIDYVLPIRCDSCPPSAHDALIAYLGTLAPSARIIVADGSPDAVAATHARRFGPVATHHRVDEDLRCRNGKVAGVRTAMRYSSNERVVIADDDVRYTLESLHAVVQALDDGDLVIPQNVFPREHLSWHARWDTARSLLNRAIGTDYPGTLAIRRSAFDAIGGYHGDVLFENLELIRTVEAAGGVVCARPDLFVLRLPPSSRRFWEQRIRQAYDDFARPSRLMLALATIPLAVTAVGKRRWHLLAQGMIASVALAEVGRRRGGAAASVPASTPLFAPVWMFERGICAWLAVASRIVLGGCRYRGVIIRRAATPRRVLRRRLQGRLHATRRTGASSSSARTDRAAPRLDAG